jgi:hypothetical protein
MQLIKLELFGFTCDLFCTLIHLLMGTKRCLKLKRSSITSSVCCSDNKAATDPDPPGRWIDPSREEATNHRRTRARGLK